MREEHVLHCNCYRFYCGRCCFCYGEECPKEPSELDIVIDSVRATLTVARKSKRKVKEKRIAAAIICLEDALARLTEEQ